MSKKYISPEHAIRDIMLNEGSGGAGKTLGKEAKGLLDNLMDLISPTSKGELVPVKPKVDTLPQAPAAAAPPAPAAPEVKSAPPVVKPVEPVKAPDIKTTSPTTTTIKTTEPVKAPDIKTDTSVKTSTENLPAVKTDTSVKTDTETKPAVKTDASVKTDTKTKAKANIREPQKPPKGKAPEGKPGFRFPGFWPGSTPGQSVHITSAGTIDVGNYLHRASDRRTFGEETRKEIVNVPRPNSSREKTMTRNQEIKNKIIDETNRKKQIVKNAVKEYSVNLNPEYKNEKLNEASGVKRALGGLGGGMVFGQDVMPKANEFLGSMIGRETRKRELTPGEAAWDTALDIGSMVPVVGAVPSAINAARRAARGDYADALVDVAGMVPFAKWLTTPMKYGGKIAKSAGLMTKLANAPAGPRGLGVIPRVADDVVGGKYSATAGKLLPQGGKFDRALDSFERNVTSPANAFQLGKGVDEFQQAFTDKPIKSYTADALRSGANALVPPAQSSELKKDEKPGLPKADAKGDLQTTAPGKGDLPMPLPDLERKKQKGPSIEIYGGPTSSAAGKRLN